MRAYPDEQMIGVSCRLATSHWLHGIRIDLSVPPPPSFAAGLCCLSFSRQLLVTPVPCTLVPPPIPCAHSHADGSSSHCPISNARGMTAHNFFSLALCSRPTWPAAAQRSDSPATLVSCGAIAGVHCDPAAWCLVERQCGGAPSALGHWPSGRPASPALHSHCSTQQSCRALLTYVIRITHIVLQPDVTLTAARAHSCTAPHKNNLRSTSALPRPAGSSTGLNWRARQRAWTLSMALTAAA